MSQLQGTPLNKIFAGVDSSEYASQWSECWAGEWTPWDRGGPSMALNDILSERPDLFESSPPAQAPGGGSERRKTALVPGCGRGHDVLLLSAFGYDVYGLDLVAGAVAEAKKNESSMLRDDIYRPRAGADAGGGRITWVSGDFFKDEWLQEAGVASGTFDLIYDYTFLCALPPSARPAWAKRMAGLLAPDGGRLVCLEYPTAHSIAEPGPPWPLRPHTYVAFLTRPGEQAPTDEHSAVIESEIGPPTEDGLKRLVHLKPARTHPSGMADGEVADWISVWSH